MLLTKNLDQLMTESLARLDGTPITEKGAGGIARLLLAIINENIADFYKTLSENHAQAFVSTAVGANLDLIGKLLNCARNNGESDTEYRYRISKSVLSLASANQTAIRLAALSVSGVKDVIMKPYTHGIGSFSIYVITDSATADTSILGAVKDKINAVKAYGVRAEIFSPKLVPVELKATLIFNKGTDELNKKVVISRVYQAVHDYINSRMPGESIVINELTQIIMASSDTIYDYQITSFKVNGRIALVANQDTRWNERFVEDSKPGAIEIR